MTEPHELIIPKRRPFPEYRSLWVSSVAKEGSVNQRLQQVKSCVVAANAGRFLRTVYIRLCVEVGEPRKVLENQFSLL